MKKALLSPCQYWQPPHAASYDDKTAFYTNITIVAIRTNVRVVPNIATFVL